MVHTTHSILLTSCSNDCELRIPFSTYVDYENSMILDHAFQQEHQVVQNLGREFDYDMHKIQAYLESHPLTAKSLAAAIEAKSTDSHSINLNNQGELILVSGLGVSPYMYSLTRILQQLRVEFTEMINEQRPDGVIIRDYSLGVDGAIHSSERNGKDVA